MMNLEDWVVDGDTGELRYWPMCSVPDCTNRRCGAFKTDKCYPHTMEKEQEIYDARAYTGN